MSNELDFGHLWTLFKDDDGNWKTNNYKAIDWLCTKIENSQTSLVIDIYGEEDDA